MNAHISELRQVLADLAPLSSHVAEFADAVVLALSEGNKVLTCGNGGSSAEAAHLAEELTGRFMRERPSLPGMCLSIDGTALTCIANDYGFDQVFSRQVEGFGRKGDVLVVFSTSGNSENVVRALQSAQERGLVTAAFLGQHGGRARGFADFEFLIPSPTGMRVQECHLFLLHILCDRIERSLLGIGEPQD